MQIKNKDGFKPGYNAIVEHDGLGSEMLMDYGVLKLGPDMKYNDNSALEKVYVLLYGHICVVCDGKKYEVKRESFLNENFWSIDVPSHVGICILGISKDSEIAVVRTENSRKFEPKVHDRDNSIIEIRGEGTMNETGTRTVRTMQDYKLAPESNIMIGEDVHYPGKWAGFPSHSHKQPEIYFYKMYPENGFGLLKLGEEGILLEHNDTVTIAPHLVHPQVAAPGYAMYFLWVIRHLNGDPYLGPDFEEQHLWVEDPGAKYWPEG